MSSSDFYFEKYLRLLEETFDSKSSLYQNLIVLLSLGLLLRDFPKGLEGLLKVVTKLRRCDPFLQASSNVLGSNIFTRYFSSSFNFPTKTVVSNCLLIMGI